MKKWGIDCVPIIQQDLSHEETLLQIAFALDSLETVASNVFRQVHANLEKGKSRLEKLQKRCNVVEAKVSKITGINKSLKVISTNKYPTRDNDVFVYTHEPAVVHKKEIADTCRPLSPDKMNMREKLKFFHVKDSSNPDDRDYERYPDEGLGDVPNNIKSVCSLYLFNSTENLYKKYKIIDPLAQQSKKRTVLEEVYKDKLVEPAPTSLDSHFDWMSRRYEKDYFYSPTQNDVPDIEAPMDLPDLPGIAGDLQFSVDKPYNEKRLVERRASLASSDTSVSTIEYIPSSVTDLPMSGSSLEDSESTSSLETVIMAPPPPPPAPPTPPPPPPPVIVDCPPPASKPSTPSGASVPQTPDMRAHLMEAIRKAGGVSTLKPIAKKPENDSKPMKKSTGNSMMDELHDKLSWRRKGISGKFDSDTNLMERMVSMIPPPPSKPPDPDSDKEWDD